MKKTGLNFNTWQEFLAYEGDFRLKFDSVLNTNLRFLDPKSLRPQCKSHRVWINLVDPEFWNAAVQAFLQLRDSQPSSLSPETESAIREDCGKTYIGPLATLYVEERDTQLPRLLTLFVYKRPDIGFWSGMSQLMAFLLSIYATESSAFAMFCHVIERLYPVSYFSRANRLLGKHSELRIFAILAERLRPKLAKALKAVFHAKNQSVFFKQTQESDFSPFVTTMKRVAETWFSSLFSTTVYPTDLARVWDCLLIYGFDFAHKFALALLSKNERFFRTAIQQETTVLGQGNSVDALLVAGNAARGKLMKKTEKLQIEKMLRKAASKATYVSVSRAGFVSKAEALETPQTERLARLRISKTLFQEKETTGEDLQRLFEELNRLQTGDCISRRLFITTLGRGHGWSEKTALNLFLTFDQRGADSVNVKELFLGLATLFNGSLDEKLGLCFSAWDEDGYGALDASRLLELVSTLEKVIDARSEVFFGVNSGLFLEMQRTADGRVTLEGFLRAFKEAQTTRPLLELMARVESGETIDGLEMRVVDFARSGEFSEVHSPMTSSDIATPVSEYEEEVPDPIDLEARLESLLQNDLREAEDLRVDRGLFSETEEHMQRLLQEEQGTQGLPARPAISLSDERYSSDRLTLNKQFLDPIEEQKDEAGRKKSEFRDGTGVSIGRKDGNNRSGCSRLCTKDMCCLS